jgi:hypothetical protein
MTCVAPDAILGRPVGALKAATFVSVVGGPRATRRARSKDPRSVASQAGAPCGQGDRRRGARAGDHNAAGG